MAKNKILTPGSTGLVDKDGADIEDSNPLPTQVIASSSDMVVTNAIDETTYDLNAAAFSETTNISNDYIFDSVDFKFSTSESRTITITTSTGKTLYTDTNRNLSVDLTKIDESFNGGENITVAITQTSGACTVTCKLKIKQGGGGLAGNPVLGAGGNIIGFVKIIGSGDMNVMTVNSEGRGDFVQHAHPDSTSIHFHANGLTAGTYRYILIDMDNVGSADNNYKHVSTDYAHVEWLEVQIDSDIQGAYTASLGFLEDVDGSDGDRYFVKHWSGAKQAGNQLGPLFESFYPNGWHMTKAKVTTHMISSGDANWSSSQTYGDSVDPSGLVNPGTGDVILEIVVTAGEIDFVIEIGYHSH